MGQTMDMRGCSQRPPAPWSSSACQCIFCSYIPCLRRAVTLKPPSIERRSNDLSIDGTLLHAECLPKCCVSARSLCAPKHLPESIDVRCASLKARMWAEIRSCRMPSPLHGEVTHMLRCRLTGYGSQLTDWGRIVSGPIVIIARTCPSPWGYIFVSLKVCGVGAGLHSQGGAEGGAKVAVCEGNSQGTLPKDRASSVSPRYWTKRA